MRKVRNAFLILLTVLLLVAGSLLPSAAAYFQDETITNAVQYESIEALKLKLEEEIPGMTYQEKIFLMMNGMGVEITDENTVIKEKEVMEAVYAAMTPYMELFFGKPFDNDYIYYYPVMLYDEGDPSRNAYYWYVNISLDVSYHDYITVILDDATGKLLAIDVTDPEWYIEDGYLQELQYSLAEIYFNELGISPVAEWPLELEATEAYEARGISVVASNYQFIDTLYGEINIEIGVRTDGFYIFFV